MVGYSIHQRPGDTSCMDHLEELKTLLHGELPKNIIADAGYGSEENKLRLPVGEKGRALRQIQYIPRKKPVRNGKKT